MFVLIYRYERTIRFMHMLKTKLYIQLQKYGVSVVSIASQILMFKFHMNKFNKIASKANEFQRKQ